MKTRSTLHVAAFTLAATCCVGLSFGARPHRVSPGKAAQIALRKFHGKLIKTPHLEHEDGRWQYEVLVRAGAKMLEVNVDAESGKIASVEKTSAAEEAREAKAEHGKKNLKPKKEKEEDEE